MADVVIVGAGVVGLGAAMLLAKDGHEVRVLERDAGKPDRSADSVWDSWDRRGVNQFRMPHMFLARYRQIIESELPEVATAIESVGGLRMNILLDTPEAIRGPEQPGDLECAILTGRRPIIESAVASAAQCTAGLTIRRGVAVEGLLVGASDHLPVPHVVGVRTESGEEIRADLVVDMSGRRSPLPRWLEAAGARPPLEHVEDTGIMYYGRHFRSRTGSLPPLMGPPLQHLGTISSLTLPTDNGTWSLSLVAHARDKALYGLRDEERWDRVARSLPLAAHWLEGDPIEDRIVNIAKLEDRRREFVIDGLPVVTGVVAVGDASACSNPSVGRGASIGMMHAVVLRDCVREATLDDPFAFTAAFHQATTEVVEPWITATLDMDRHRMAEIEAGIRGEEYRPKDPSWEIGQAVASAAMKDGDCFRLFVKAAMVLQSPQEALGAPGLFDKVVELGSGWRDDPILAPSRDELIALVAR